jgi:hypothetical protein
MPSGNGG